MSALSSTLPDDLVGAVASFMNVKTLLRLSLTNREIRFGFVWDRLRALDAIYDCNDGLELSYSSDHEHYRAMGRSVVRLIATLFERGVRFRSLQRVTMHGKCIEIPDLDALNPLLQHLASERRLKSVSVRSSQLHLIRQEDIEDLTVINSSATGPLDWFQQPLPKLRSLQYMAPFDEDADDDAAEGNALITVLEVLARQLKNLPVLERLSCMSQCATLTQAQSVLRHLADIYKNASSKINYIGVSNDLLEILDEDGPPLDDFRGIPLSALRLICRYKEPTTMFPHHLSTLREQFRAHPDFSIGRDDPAHIDRHSVAVSSTERLRDLIHGSFRSADYIDDLCFFTSDADFLYHEEWYIAECSRILEAWKADPFCSIDKILKLVVISASILHQYRAFAQEYIDQSLKFLLEYAPVLIRELPERCCMDNADALSHTVLRDVILNMWHVFRTKITLRFLLTYAPLLRRLQLPHDLVATSLRIGPFEDTWPLLRIGVDPFVLMERSLNLLPSRLSVFHWYQEMDYLCEAIGNMPNQERINEKLAEVASKASEYTLQTALPDMADFISDPTLENFRSAVNVMKEKLSPGSDLKYPS